MRRSKSSATPSYFSIQRARHRGLSGLACLVAAAVIASGLAVTPALPASAAPASPSGAVAAPLPPPTQTPAASEAIPNPTANAPKPVVSPTALPTKAVAKPLTGFVPGRSIEDQSARTATSKTFVNPDGTYSTQIASIPLHYWDGHAWQDIDNSIVADPTRPGVLRNTANGFIARFAPLNDGISVDADGTTFTMVPQGASPTAVPTVGPDGQTVVYHDAWPGVDLEYRVVSDHVKEDIVLRRRPVTSTFTFALSGGTVTARSDGGLDLDGPLAGTWWILPPVVLDRSGAPVEAAAPRLVPQDGGARVMVTVDGGWLAGLRTSDFPVTIDPTVTTLGGYPSRAYSDTGHSCIPCAIRVGRDDNNQSGKGNGVWRTAVYFDYTTGGSWSMSGATVLQDSNLEIHSVDSSPAAGAQSMAIFGMTNPQSFGPLPPAPIDQASGDGSYNFSGPGLLSYYQSLLDNKTTDGYLMFEGNETPGQYSFKELTYFLLTLDTNRPPSSPSYNVPSSPNNGATVYDTQGPITFSASATDDGGPIFYTFDEIGRAHV